MEPGDFKDRTAKDKGQGYTSDIRTSEDRTTGGATEGPSAIRKTIGTCRKISNPCTIRKTVGGYGKSRSSDVIRKMVVEYGRIPNPYVIRKIAGAYTGIQCPRRIGKTAGACAGILYSSTIRKASVYRRIQSRRILKAHSAVSKVQTSEEARKYYATKCSGDQARYKTFRNNSCINPTPYSLKS